MGNIAWPWLNKYLIINLIYVSAGFQPHVIANKQINIMRKCIETLLTKDIMHLQIDLFL